MTDNSKTSGLKTRTIWGIIIALGGLCMIYLGGWPLIILIGLAYFVSLSECLNIARKGLQTLPVFIGGVVYLSACFLAFYILRFSVEAGVWWALTVITSIALADSLAYFMGKSLNGPKLAPAISPKKTWAGLAGSVIGATIIMVAMGAVIPSYYSSLLGEANLVSQGLFYSFVLGISIGLVGQGGDLLISFFKRRSNLKDAGHLIPGHGGLLDRIDSHLMAVLIFTLVKVYS